MRRKRTLFVGFMAFTLAVSTTLSPVSAGMLSGNMVGNNRLLVETAEKKFVLTVEGMEDESFEVSGPGDYDNVVPVKNGKIESGNDASGNPLKDKEVYFINLSEDNKKYPYRKAKISVNDEGKKKNEIGFQIIGDKLIEFDLRKFVSLDNEIKKLVVHSGKGKKSDSNGNKKGDRIEAGKDVNVADIEVVFEDGTIAPDGIVLDNFNMEGRLEDPRHYKVKDGKISGIVMKADERYKLGFDVSNADFKNYEVVGAYKSKKFMSVYARYEGGVLLKFDYDTGVSAPEEKISTIVIKRADGTTPEPPKSKFCLAILNLRDNETQPNATLTFRLIRKDNDKSKPVSSDAYGSLTINCEGDVDYELVLEENPLYKLKNKIEFKAPGYYVSKCGTIECDSAIE